PTTCPAGQAAFVLPTAAWLRIDRAHDSGPRCSPLPDAWHRHPCDVRASSGNRGMTADGQRYLRLDVVRGVAALWVMLFHAWQYGTPSGPAPQALHDWIAYQIM